MKKFLKVLLALVCIASAYALTVNFWMIGSAKKQIVSDEQLSGIGKTDCVLVLGCGVKPDGTPSDMLRERVLKGSEAFKQSEAEYILVSGDVNGNDEPGVMKRLCEEHGIDTAKIVKGDAGFSTYESIYNAKQSGVKRLIIITQSYHMPRALYIARSMGLEAYGCEAHLLRYKMQIVWSAREVLARNKDFIKCIFDGI